VLADELLPSTVAGPTSATVAGFVCVTSNRAAFRAMSSHSDRASLSKQQGFQPSDLRIVKPGPSQGAMGSAMGFIQFAEHAQHGAASDHHLSGSFRGSSLR
jgi:hypothetical protein